MRKLLALVFSAALLAISILALLSVTRSITTPANAAPNQIEIIAINELSSTSVEILFSSSVPKKSLSYFVINAATDPSVGMPKSIKKIIKTKATGLITTQIKNLNPKVAYKFTVSAKTNKARMINSAAVEYASLSILMDALSNLPAGWGTPKPTQLPAAAPAVAPLILPAFTLTSSTETRTVNTAAAGFTINSTGGAIASFAINATPSNMSFNTTTGALTGTPNTIAGATTYTITATNATGSATQTFTLTVAIAAPAFTLSSSSETRTVNTAATGFTINSTGGAIASFAINSTPSGMSFNTTSGALTGTPNTVAGATAYTITATNSSGSATQTFTLTVNAKATPSLSSFANISKASGAPAFTLTDPTVAGTVSGAFTYTSATTATATIAGATVTVVSGGTTLITATFTPTDTTEYNNATITMTLTVAYAVGNRGPGGGIVFYVSADVFTQTGATGGMCTTDCKYLEAAPTTGTDLWTDAKYVWSGNTGVAIGATAQGTAIGTGYANTLAIVRQSDGGNTAARASTISRAYGGPNSLSDWFLPSKDELNQMCKWAKGITGVNLTTLTTSCAPLEGVLNTTAGAAGFVADWYWSSTESNAVNAWFQMFRSTGGGQGTQDVVVKSFNGSYVRPIRAFGP